MVTDTLDVGYVVWWGCWDTPEVKLHSVSSFLFTVVKSSDSSGILLLLLPLLINLYTLKDMQVVEVIVKG